MIYQQQIVAADAPAMTAIMGPDVPGSSLSCFCAAAEDAAETADGAVSAATAAASSGFY